MPDYDVLPMQALIDAMMSPQAPQTLAGRMELANQLLAPLCVDEDGNEYVGPPMIDHAGYLAIISGG